MKDKIDQLVWEATFGENKEEAYLEIKKIGKENGIFLSSINNLYKARAKDNSLLSFSVPAINIRGLTYDVAKTALKVAVSQNVRALIFEIARSEIKYTKQSPKEYVSAIMAAAIHEGFQGPLFIQGDHFQAKSRRGSCLQKKGDMDELKSLIKESIEAGFYNIDIDMSTLVDYSQTTVEKQQRQNYEASVELAKYVRQIEPEGITISLGGEIGHIGGKNSTKEELITYMENFNRLLPKGLVGLSKIAIQTGTHHGGLVLEDGSLGSMKIDFSILKELSQLARKYDMGGAVQHGASTLPDKYFPLFVKNEAVEVHLATGFQNLIMDHPQFPQKLLDKMYKWIDNSMGSERINNETLNQFHYKLRKKAWGEFKEECWSLPEEIKKPIMNDLEKRFIFLFKSLGISNNSKILIE